MFRSSTRTIVVVALAMLCTPSHSQSCLPYVPMVTGVDPANITDNLPCVDMCEVIHPPVGGVSGAIFFSSQTFASCTCVRTPEDILLCADAFTLPPSPAPTTKAPTPTAPPSGPMECPLSMTTGPQCQQACFAAGVPNSSVDFKYDDNKGAVTSSCTCNGILFCERTPDQATSGAYTSLGYVGCLSSVFLLWAMTLV